MNAKLALIALLAVGLALVSATAERADSSIPVEAEDAELSALDAEADEALHLVGTGQPGRVQAAEESFDALDAEMGVGGLNLNHNLDLSMPVDTDSAEDHVGEDEALDADEDVALVAEAESVSIAVADDAADSAESASAAVDSDENASFLQVDEEEEESSDSEDEVEDEESDEAEGESEESDESEESEDADEEEEAIEAALIVIEADVASDSEGESEADAMSSEGVELVADAETAQAAAATNVASATIADEDVAAEASHAVDMAEVTDFDTAKLAAKEQENVRTAGAVTAGLADATIEASGVAAEASPYDAEVIAVVSDKLARTAAGAAAFVETGAAVGAEAEADMPFSPATEQQQAEEQQRLDLMHSILIQLRKEQGRPLNDEMTPADMDAIEEKMASVSLVEVSAAADTETAAAAAATTASATGADASAEHPRDHTVLVTHVVPEVADTTPGAKLSRATIIAPPRAVKPPRDPFRWDIQYRADKRQFMPHDHVELVENAHPRHRRDPTAPTKLKKPVKPAVWDRRPWDTTPKQQYRYDVTYEKRSACCRRREACCIRGVDTKTVAAKVKKPVRIVDPSKPEPQPKPQLKAVKADKKKAKSKKAKAKMVTPKSYRYDVEFEGQRAKCCAARSACCAPPQAMYRADVQYLPGGSADGWVVVSDAGERGVVVEVDAEELQMLSRIQQRQALLHKLLLTHDSPYYYDDHFDGIAVVPADAAHIVQFHEPRAARDPQQLTVAEQAELNAWMQQLPVVPHLSVVEIAADAHARARAAQGTVFLQTEDGVEAEVETSARRLVPARVLKGFVDVQQQPSNLASLLAALPPMPAAAEERVDEMEEALAQAEADAENDDL